MFPGDSGQASGGDGDIICRDTVWSLNTENTHTRDSCADRHTLSRSTPPPPPQSTVKPHVSVGINRSAQNSSHPALKSFPEVVLQKPAAEEDKRTAIPQARRLLSSTQLSLCSPSSPVLAYPYLPSTPHYFYPPFFSSPSHPFCPICPLLPSGPSYNSPFCAFLSRSPPLFVSIPFSSRPHLAVFLQHSVINESHGPYSRAGVNGNDGHLL